MYRRVLYISACACVRACVWFVNVFVRVASVFLYVNTHIHTTHTNTNILREVQRTE